MQKLNKTSLAHYHQGVSSSKNEMKMHDKTHAEYFYSMNSRLKKMDDFTINKILLSNKVTKEGFSHLIPCLPMLRQGIMLSI